VIQHPEIIPMLLEPPLNVVSETPEVHTYHQGGHGEENVGPHQHVEVVQKVHDEGADLQDELPVVGHRTSLLPGGGHGADPSWRPAR